MINKIVKQQTKKNKEYKQPLDYKSLRKDYLLVKALDIFELLEFLSKVAKHDDKLLDYWVIRELLKDREDFSQAIYSTEKFKLAKGQPKPAKDRPISEDFVKINKLYNFKSSVVDSLSKKLARYNKAPEVPKE